jgi:hypothetical protein
VFVNGGGTVTNAGAIAGGSYAVNFANSPTNRLVIDPGATFTGGVNGGGGTLELAAGTGASAVAGIDSGVFNNFQALVIDSGASWTLNGANTAPTVFDNGMLTIAGSLAVSAAVDPSSTGVFQIGNNATLEVAADTGAHTQISFVAAGGLVIDSAASFGTNVGTSSYTGPQLQNFASGDSIDLKDFSFAGATLTFDPTAGLLQLSNSANQAASLSFQSSSLGPGTFQLASDGTSGVLVTHA